MKRVQRLRATLKRTHEIGAINIYNAESQNKFFSRIRKAKKRLRSGRRKDDEMYFQVLQRE